MRGSVLGISPSAVRLVKEVLAPHSKLLGLGALFMMVAVALQIPMPLILMYLLDHAEIGKNTHLLSEWIGLLFAIVILRSVFGYFQTSILSDARTKVMMELRSRLFAHLLSAPLTYFHGTKVGYVVSQITTDESQIRGFLTSDSLTLLREGVTFVVGAAFLAWLNWKMFLVSISAIPFYAIWLTTLNPRVRAETKVMQESYFGAASDMVEAFTGIYLVKVFVAEQVELRRMLNDFYKALQADRTLSMTMNTLGIGSAIISASCKIWLIWLGLTAISDHQLTIGQFVAFNSFLPYLFDPTSRLLALSTNLQQSRVAFDRITGLLSIPQERDTGPSQKLRIRKASISFRDLSFHYPHSSAGVRDISLEIAPGETLALVGSSGAGKSTLVNLLLRLYLPERGAIYIDGVDISTVSLRSLRDQVAVVPQQPHLFADTIRNNMRYANPTATDMEIEECARLANVHQFVSSLPQGYDTIVGERGTTLSGGERQRICLAMAFLKNAPILVLDEATSSVDSTAERSIQEAMQRLMAKRTTIVVAHRLSTVQNADTIAVIEDGRLAQVGRHEQLVQIPGRYASLYADFVYDAPATFAGSGDIVLASA